jgi:hypothetical protein
VVIASLSEIDRILQSPPDTWQQYEKKGEPWGIVEMELRECKAALKKYMEDPEKAQPADTELMHVAAALINMRAYLQAQTKKD